MMMLIGMVVLFVWSAIAQNTKSLMLEGGASTILLYEEES
jgi:hypothetical protein